MGSHQSHKSDVSKGSHKLAKSLGSMASLDSLGTVGTVGSLGTVGTGGSLNSLGSNKSKSDGVKDTHDVPVFDKDIQDLLKRNNIEISPSLSKKNPNAKLSDIIQQAENTSLRNLTKLKNNNISESEKSKFFAKYMK
jgi:hypothetical protein